ncbi:MAG: glycosyltransferase family 39 protein [Akkermansiaceae bacterium]|nr:glycosyltransferase family 39 protein [Akkermansiaceae bacterium]MCF7732313.1 glycosyltransferase family 39 protein [Akkermansiaceae bacterium]
MNANSNSVDPAVIIRRVLFFLVLIALTLGNLFTLFRGLDSPQAMEQAQIAREISRGNGFTTKFIRPVAYAQEMAAKGTSIPFDKFEDTYHSPLNPLINAAVLKLVNADDAEAWKMGKNELIYPLDRVIAMVSTLFFLISIGVTYLLVSRIFDTKIAAVTAILMLFCETFWQYSLSGLPQMLMLMLFSSALYFAFRAVEASVEGRIAMTPAVISGVFFSLLALTHWMTVWIALGYLIFAAIVYRPRGVVSVVVVALILIPGVFVMIRNTGISGSAFGTAYLTLHNGLAGSEDTVMRSTSIQHDIPLNNLISKIIRVTMLQATQIIPLLAGIVIAPLFFLSLLHPFKRQSIAIFRWGVLLMWITTAIGLAFFGVSSDKIDPNQLHLLFAPIMTAYGLAFISILWNRLDFVAANGSLRHAHYIGVVVLCALPLVLGLPQRIKLGMEHRDKGGLPHWPPYYAPALNLKLKRVVPVKQMIYSDQPWAVAWYADRISMWLPREMKDFEEIENASVTLDTPAAGILITPSSYGSTDMLTLRDKYQEFTSLVMDGQALTATAPPGVSLYDRDPKIADAVKRFPHRIPLLNYFMTFYSERPIRTSDVIDN